MQTIARIHFFLRLSLGRATVDFSNATTTHLNGRLDSRHGRQTRPEFRLLFLFYFFPPSYCFLYTIKRFGKTTTRTTHTQTHMDARSRASSTQNTSADTHKYFVGRIYLYFVSKNISYLDFTFSWQFIVCTPDAPSSPIIIFCYILSLDLYVFAASVFFSCLLVFTFRFPCSCLWWCVLFYVCFCFVCKYFVCGGACEQSATSWPMHTSALEFWTAVFAHISVGGLLMFRFLPQRLYHSKGLLRTIPCTLFIHSVNIVLLLLSPAAR